MKKYLFLDRDGVINRDSPHYIKSWQEFEFLPGSMEAFRILRRAGYSAIVITNQSAINRGLAPRETVKQIHTRMREAVQKEGGLIQDVFYCPHQPSDHCSCRKPEPGLILAAREKYRIHLPDTVMVGDSARDISCALNAGCGQTVLVRTGNGEAAQAELEERGVTPDRVATDLLDAARWLCDL